ncbi:MAG: ion channel [Arachnia propionica]|uniref:ion channel n=1 Tax=Arachnia propionica TaxID=1750 RepID=UPI0026FCF481|nr:ion channel [Arachnia propionica]
MPQPPIAWSWLRGVIVTALVVTIYHVVPVRTGEELWGRGALSFAMLIALAVLITHQVKNHPDRVGRLITTLVADISLCALACYALATQVPGEFAGLATRTDALYFTMVTMTTVGFGDVHPVGQHARLLVTAMIAFSLLFLELVARTLGAGISAAREGSAAPGQPEPETKESP